MKVSNLLRYFDGENQVNPPLPEPTDYQYVFDNVLKEGFYTEAQLLDYAEQCRADLVAEINGWKADQKENLANQCDLQAEINALRAENERLRDAVGRVNREREIIRAEVERESKAASHWMKDANDEHNKNVKLEAEVERLKAQPSAVPVVTQMVEALVPLKAVAKIKGDDLPPDNHWNKLSDAATTALVAAQQWLKENT